MNYTIARLKDILNDIQIDFSKDGDKYQVGIYHNYSKEYTYNDFDTLEEAYKIFEKLAKVIIERSCSYEQRKELLFQK